MSALDIIYVCLFVCFFFCFSFVCFYSVYFSSYMFVPLSNCPFVCLSVNLSVFFSIFLFVHQLNWLSLHLLVCSFILLPCLSSVSPFVWLSVCTSSRSSICQFVRLLICQFIHWSVCPIVYLSVFGFYPSIRLSVHMSFYSSIQVRIRKERVRFFHWFDIFVKTLII